MARKPNAMVAAATRIDLRVPDVAKRQASKRQSWQVEAWAYNDEVPEIKESVRYRGDQLAKVGLYVAVDVDGEPVPVTDDESGVPASVAVAASMELERLKSRSGGQAEILRMLSMNYDVAGECYLIGRGERTKTVVQTNGDEQTITVGEDWQIKSISEVDVKGSGPRSKYVVKSDPDDTKGEELDPDSDAIIRMWLRHPQWGNRPDSPMRALLTECATLQTLTQQVQAEANSRQSAGAFTVPNELSFGPPDPTTPTDGLNDTSGDPFQAELQRALTEPIADPSSPSSVVPMLVRGPAEYLKAEYLRVIEFGRDQSESLEKRIDARVARIARGLNLPVETVMGLEETTFANAAQVDQDEYQKYLQPSVEQVTEALTFAFLTPQLEANPSIPPDWSDGRLFIAADPSDLIADPDREANADEAFDRNTISADAYRRAKGFRDEDEPDPLELLVRAGLRRGIMTGDITIALLELLGIELDIPEPEPEGGLPLNSDDEATAEAALQLAAAGITLADAAKLAPVIDVPPRNAGADLMAIDRDLRTRLVVASNEAMTRALDRAASRLKSRTNGTEQAAILRNVPKPRMFAHLGPSLVAQAFGDNDPLDGVWDDLQRQFFTWGEQAQDQALDVASRISSGFTTAQRDQLKLRQAADLDEAWGWMHEALTSLAEELLFDPDPSIPDLGEFDPTLKVPTGLVRQALARAGGGTGLIEQEGGGVAISLVDAGTRPAGGIGTGELVRDVLRDAGAVEAGFRWDYGPAFRARPFDPHVSLDGVEFENFDDPVLANFNAFPPGAFYLPGDHRGCICDFEPIIAPPPLNEPDLPSS